MKLSVVIVNYNVKYFLEQCLHSCEKAFQRMKDVHPDWDAEIFVVDNNSVDGSVELLKERFSQVKLLANKDNKGFSKANNQAIRQSNAEYVLLLNPDTVVEEDTFLSSLEFMDAHPKGGGLGVKMIDGKGDFLPESKRGLPTPDVAFYKIFGLSSLFPKSKTFGKYHLGYLDDKQVHEVDTLAGAFMLLRMKTLEKIGLLDETFFMYGEDIDLSYRITQAGYCNYYYPHTRIIHYKGESTKKDSVNYVFVFYNAMIIFAKKHFSRNHANLFAFLINMAIYFRAGISLFNRFIRNISHPFFDWALNLSLLTLLTHGYESYVKYPNGNDSYPQDFFNFILPIYSLIWVLAIASTGSYKWLYQIKRMFKGVLLGTLAVSILYAFLDESLRFSRAIVLLGAACSFIAFFATRWLTHLIKEGNPFIGKMKTKRMLLVGGQGEAERVNKLLQHTGVDHEVVGLVSPFENTGNGYIGNVNQLDEAVKIHKIDEVIFCSKDLKSSSIFNAMLNISKDDVYYKIVPEQSVFIIGSNSKNEPGDYYTIDVKLALKSPENLFNKRVVDLLVSTLLILTLPLNMFFVNNKKQYLNNLAQVFMGKLTWVGYSSSDVSKSLPSLRKGVLKPTDKYDGLELEVKAVSRIDLAYARNYHFSKDLDLILRGFSRLGSSV